MLPLGLFNLSMRILITGGFGFIGGRLATHFSQAGHEVVLGSRGSRNPPNWLPQAKVARINWSDQCSLESSCENIHTIIHAAGMNAHDCALHPIAALNFNGKVTERLVEAASRMGAEKFIYISTAHVYASPLAGTITEKTLPNNPHPYASSNLAGESAVLNANDHGVIQGIVIRLSNAFGVPTDKDINCWHLLVHSLCKQVVQTRKLVLETSGHQQRDFICIGEVCRVVEILVIDDISKKMSILNVGSGISQSVREIAVLIQQRCVLVLGFEPKLLYKEVVANEEHVPLTFTSEKMALIENNIQNKNNLLEIDRLLKFCKIAFPKE